MSDEINRDHLRLLEAVLFASAEPMTERVLGNRLPEDANVKALLAELQDQYAGRGVNLIHAGGSWAFRTAEDLAAQMTKQIEITRKLSRAAGTDMTICARL